MLLLSIPSSWLTTYSYSVSYEEGSRLMKREVVKLVTPGTLLEPLDQHANYLLSIFPGPSKLLGLAWIDLSTAAFQVILLQYNNYVIFIYKIKCGCLND